MLAKARRSLAALLVAAVLIVCINAGFTVSLLKVDAAKALLLISLNPLWAALMGKLLLNDPLPTRTVVTMLLSLVSTLIVFVPTLQAITGLGLDDDADALDDEAGGPAGEPEPLIDPIDLVPLVTGVTVASLLTFSRWQAHASLELAPFLGALLTACCASTALVLLEGDTIDALVVGLQTPFWLALIGSALGSAVYDTALVIAPRALSSAEVALILLAESVFGPFWVWLAFDDAPDGWTIAGGALLLTALAGHELVGMLTAQQEDPLKLDSYGRPISPAHSRCSDEAQLFSRGFHRSPQLGSFRELATSRSGSADSEGNKRAILLEEDFLEMPGPMIPLSTGRKAGQGQLLAVGSSSL